jgi:hypothetical protein
VGVGGGLGEGGLAGELGLGGSTSGVATGEAVGRTWAVTTDAGSGMPLVRSSAMDRPYTFTTLKVQ